VAYRHGHRRREEAIVRSKLRRRLTCAIVVSTSCLLGALAAPALAQASLVTSNVTQKTDLGKSTAVVNYSEPTQTDDGSGPAVAVSCTPGPGSTFKLGDSTVNCSGFGYTQVCTTRDVNSGMCIASISVPVGEGGSFTVTVKDGEAPVLSQPADITAVAPHRAISVGVHYALPSATDNVGVTSVTCSPPSGSSFVTGTALVVCTAKDAAGNSNSKTFHVMVVGTCLVPALIGKKLKAAKRALTAAHCTLGTAKEPKRTKGKLIVKSQSPSPGTVLPDSASVSVKLGPKHRRNH
jgi:hypothetical protein